MIEPAKAEPIKDAVRSHLKKINLPPRKYKSLPAGFEWLAFLTYPQRERLAEFHLSRAGATAFLPMEVKARRANRHVKRMISIELPLLTRCLFVGFEPGQPMRWQEVCSLPMVQGVLAVWEGDGMQRPVVITETQMHVMLGSIKDMARTNPRRSFGLGDLVRIREGAFGGFLSKVQKIQGQNARLELHILGSARSVEIPLELLEAA